MRSLEGILADNLKAVFEVKIMEALRKNKTEKAFLEEVQKLGVKVQRELKHSFPIVELEDAWKKGGDNAWFATVKRLWAAREVWMHWQFFDRNTNLHFLTLDSRHFPKLHSWNGEVE